MPFTDEITAVPTPAVLDIWEKFSAFGQREDKDSGIIWKKNGNNLAHGNIHCVALQESSGEGNYSCHDKDGSLLNHTQVLILEANKKRILQTDSFKCSTPNYNGTFHCSWSWHPIRVGKVALIKVWRPSNSSDLHCTEDSSGHWSCRTSRSDFSCSVDLSGHGFSCTDHQHCPFAEEAHFIHITLYVVYDFHIENYSKNFYLSEIVKPDKVHIRKVKDNTVEWIYPSTWDNPYSYFPLTFQLAQLKDKTACGDIKTRKALYVGEGRSQTSHYVFSFKEELGTGLLLGLASLISVRTKQGGSLQGSIL
uniref:Interleukin-12 subunit beta n=1 Tax=Knipowitschia caucasica TaxID=637954 RepID=A0AAV2MKL3_KNICA